MNNQANNLKDIIISDLEKEANKTLSKHLDGRNYNELKVDEWNQNILRDIENYFKEKYPNYFLFYFVLYAQKSLPSIPETVLSV